MSRASAWLAAAAAAAVLSACHATPPPRVAASIPKDYGPAAWPRLSVAVVKGDNVAGSIDYLGRWVSGLGPFGEPMSADKIWRDARSAVDRHFKASLDAPSMLLARGAADVVAVLDVYAQGPNSIFSPAKVQLSAAFYGPDGAKLETLEVESEKSVTKETPFGMAVKRMKKTMGIASEDAAERLAEQVGKSPALAALSKAAKAPAPGASAPPAVVYRSDVEKAPFRLPEDETKFALVVGIESYSSLPPAQFAARDARAVKAHLLALGYPERNIALITDQQAGKAALEKYLEAWLPARVDGRSKVFVYFSGHGAPDPGKGQAYLVPWDGDPKFIASTGYPLKRLYEKLNSLKARQVLLAMDSCFSGVGGRSVIAQGIRPLVGRIDTGAGLAGRVSAVTASAADEITGAHESAGHGLFTYHLLKELGASSGRATLKELHGRLSPRVQDAARRDNRDQTPQLLGAGDAPL